MNYLICSEQSFSSDHSGDWSEDFSAVSNCSSPKRIKIDPSDKTNLNKRLPKNSKKPGRKAIGIPTELPSDPKLKRVVQNRAAQRAFRERKENLVQELQAQLKELEEAKQAKEKELLKTIYLLKDENERLKEENYLLKEAKFPMVIEKKTADKKEKSSKDSCTGDMCCPFDAKTHPILNDLYNNHYTDSVFGKDVDIFSSIENSIPFTNELVPLLEKHEFNEQTKILKCAPENEQPCKLKIIHLLNKAKGKNRKIDQLNDDIKSYCPDIDVDLLCKDLKRNFPFEKKYILTDKDIDAYIEYIKKSA